MIKNLHLFFGLIFFTFSVGLFAQENLQSISLAEVQRIEKVLAADNMQGRNIFHPSIDSAAAFIAAEFVQAGLSPFQGDTFLQGFEKDTSAIVKPLQHTRPVKFNNVVGIIPGSSKKDEYVIFSAHYDHLGIGRANAAGDSIYNGANDDASGVTAVIVLGAYFSKLKQNERTLIFVAFTGEESGGYGSSYFSQQIDPGKVKAMFNIEMIGTESKWGKNSAYITGYEQTDMGAILKKNLKNSLFTFRPDPYPEFDLFYRSDNATLARLGVPAHTISTSRMDQEIFYHTADDEIESLDLDNMTFIIRSIALSARSIIAGKDTPTRVDASRIRKTEVRKD